MLANVPLHDFKNFKPDVVICPHCTQHLMGVRDIRWAANKVEFTYGCDGCGKEIDKTIAEDALREPAPMLDAVASAPVPSIPEEDKSALQAEDLSLAPFPFKPAAPKPTQAKPLQTKPVPARPVQAEPAEPRTDRGLAARQTFIEDRVTRTPRQVFDDRQPPEKEAAPVASRASVLLRDVTIFNL